MPSYRNSDPAPPIMAGFPPPPEWRVPARDWDAPPWNRWTFQRVREFVPTAPIRRGATVLPLPEAAGRMDDLAFDLPSGRATTFAQMLDETYTDAMLIAVGGRIIHESYHNGMDRSSVHLLQSVSKSITATAAAGLIDEGAIDPDAPVTTYLPELAETAWAGATVQQVLDMTTGVRFVEDYDARDSDIGKMDYASAWRPAPEGVDPSGWPQSMWDQILSLKVREAPHGSRFAYRSIETDVYGHIAQRVAGQRIPDLISNRLWQPLGCETEANITVDRNGYGLSCGGMSASLRDLARFALALLNDGQAGGRQVIPRAWIADIRRGQHGLFNDISRAEMPNGLYRDQFWIEDAGLERHACLGIFGQMIYVAPDLDLIAVKLSTWPTALNASYRAHAMAAIHAAARAVRA